MIAPDAFPAHLEEPADGPLRFVARAADVDGIAVPDVDLTVFERNPVVLWAHDYDRLPIGRGAAFVKDDCLLVDVTFDLADPFAAEVERKYRAGFLHAVSIGYRVPDLRLGDDGRPASGQRWQLLELSAVCLPQDPGALVYRKAVLR